MRRNRWTAILFAIALFACGAICGALGHRYLTARAANPPGRSAEDFRQHYISEMKTELKLSADQVSQLDAILDDTKAKYKAVRDESRPAMLKIKQDQIARVKSILNPSQVAAYDRLIAEHERRFRDQEDRDRQADQRREAERHHHASP